MVPLTLEGLLLMFSTFKSQFLLKEVKKSWRLSLTSIQQSYSHLKVHYLCMRLLEFIWQVWCTVFRVRKILPLFSSKQWEAQNAGKEQKFLVWMRRAWWCLSVPNCCGSFSSSGPPIYAFGPCGYIQKVGGWASPLTPDSHLSRYWSLYIGNILDRYAETTIITIANIYWVLAMCLLCALLWFSHRARR